MGPKRLSNRNHGHNFRNMRKRTLPLLFIVGMLLFAASQIRAQVKNDPEYPVLPSSIMDAKLKPTKGPKFTLSSHKGKVVLVNLWAIWCAPCRPLFPAIVELQDKYKDQGFEVIGLNAGNDAGKTEKIRNITRFARKLNLNITLVQGQSKVTNAIFKVANFDALPVTLILDRQGRLRAVIGGRGPMSIRTMNQEVAKIMDEKVTDQK